MDDSSSKLFRAAKFLSIFSVKALAILEALHFVSQKEIKQVSIFSDLKSVLESLMKSNILGKSSVLIVAIKDLVRRLESLGYEIKLIWIPAHKGIKENEMADKKAKEAIRLGIDTQIQIPPGDLKLLWKETVHADFLDWCKNTGVDRGTFYMNNYLTMSRRPWFSKFELCRRGIVSLCRMRSRHTSLKESLFRFRIVDSPNCDWCNEPESINHVFWQCSKYETSRKTMTSSLLRVVSSLSIPIESLLSIMDQDIYYSLGRFISEIDSRI